MLDPYGSILFGGIAKRSLIAQSALDFNRSIFDIFTRKFYSSYWRIDWRAILNKPWGFETKRNNFLSYRMGWNIWKQYTYFFNNKLLIRNSTRNVRFETVATLLTAAYPASQHCCEAENAAAKSETVMKKYEIARLTNPSQSLIAAEELALLFETFPILKHPLSESNFVSTPLSVWYSIEAPGRILSLFCNSNCMILPNALICKKREQSKWVWKQLQSRWRSKKLFFDWLKDGQTYWPTDWSIDWSMD